MSEHSYFLVIPAFNEESTIKDIVNQALLHCPNVIVINDGSTDNTFNEIRNLPILRLDNPTNMGKGYSLILGMKLALCNGANYIITLDGDGQHRPEDIANLVKASRINPDVLIIGARRLSGRSVPLKNMIGNWCANFSVSWATGFPVKDSQSGFRIYPKRLLEKVGFATLKSDRYLFETNVLIEIAAMDFPVHHVEIPVIYNKEGRASHFRAFNDFCPIFNLIALKIICSRFNLKFFYRLFVAPRLKELFFFGFNFIEGVSKKIKGK